MSSQRQVGPPTFGASLLLDGSDLAKAVIPVHEYASSLLRFVATSHVFLQSVGIHVARCLS